MNQNDRRVVRTKKAIRAAFLSLLEEQDFSKVTIAGIARAADIDRKTFYLHYDSVDALADELVGEEADKLIAACRRVMLDGEGHVDVGNLFEQLSMGLSPDRARRRRFLEHVSIEELLRRIEQPLMEGIIKDDLLGLQAMGAYLPYAVSFFCGGLISVYRRWLLSDGTIPQVDIARMTRACMFTGIDGLVAGMPAATSSARVRVEPV